MSKQSTQLNLPHVDFMLDVMPETYIQQSAESAWLFCKRVFRAFTFSEILRFLELTIQITSQRMYLSECIYSPHSCRTANTPGSMHRPMRQPIRMQNSVSNILYVEQCSLARQQSTRRRVFRGQRNQRINNHQSNIPTVHYVHATRVVTLVVPTVSIRRFQPQLSSFYIGY